MPRRLSYLSLSLLVLLLAVGGGSGHSQELTASPPEAAASPENSPAQATPELAPTPSAPTLGAGGTVGNGASFLPDTANSTKFYTITASLREEYDDNIYTTKNNKKSSPVTEFSPSFLVSFPEQDSTFSARYTFGLDYYSSRSGNPVDYTHEVLVRYTHQFGDRFSLDLRDQGGYYTQPDLLNGVGTPFVNGQYFENTATAEFDAQWTPLFGTTTSYSNVALLYQDSEISKFQNYDENTISQDFRFAVYPKYNLVANGTFDDTDYFEFDRGYRDVTLDVGVDWQALPNISVSVRGGATFTNSEGVPNSLSPYASASLQWKLGKRSELDFSYLHDVVPTDVTDAVGQEADRFTLRFNYELTARINIDLAGTYTHADYSSELLQGGASSFTEDDIGVNLGLSYSFNSTFSIEAGYLLSDISSQEDDRDYTRNQVYIGVRGTY
jgi:hypothetical protein